MAADQGLKAALHRRAGFATLLLTGADRTDYLHRMLTQDVKGIAAGEAGYACLLTAKGRILGDLLLWNVGDHLLVETDAAAQPAVQPVLERYVIMDDVQIEDVSPLGVRYVLVGPDAERVLTRAGFDVPADRCFIEVEAGGAPGRILRFDRRGLQSFEIAVAPAAAAQLEERLGLTADSVAFAACCVHHGVPRFGPELSEDVLLNEAGLEEAIAWGKGCYPGQEPVVMARHRGRPPRLLVKLSLDDGALVTPGTEVLSEGQVVGHVTSTAPGDGCPAVALAYVKFALAEAGRRFELATGGTATAEDAAPAEPTA